MDYMKVHNLHFHTAIITKRNKIIATSRNTVGTRSRGSGWDHRSLHAEIAVVKSLGDLSQLRGCTLVVIRLNKQGETRNSKPCEACESFIGKCMKKYGLLKCMYST